MDKLGSLRLLPLPDGVTGKLWLSAMPGRFEPLTAFIAAAVEVGGTEIVCLASTEEIATRSPDYALARMSGTLALRVRDYPVPDLNVPIDSASFAEFVMDICVKLYRGERLIVHCAAGIGRTGLVAQQVLMAFGVEPSIADKQVQHAGSGPETDLQKELCDAPVTLFPWI